MKQVLYILEMYCRNGIILMTDKVGNKYDFDRKMPKNICMMMTTLFKSQS